jgi:uncharacterized protein (DUF362 family)
MPSRLWTSGSGRTLGQSMNRRTFLKHTAALCALPLSSSRADVPSAPRAQVAVVRTDDRAAGVRRAIDLLGRSSLGAHLFIKPNYNSADPTPGSTHPEVLRALLSKMREMGVTQFTIGDRSGMGDTRRVLQACGVFEIAEPFGAQVLVLDEIPAEGWKHFSPPSSHWERGFALPRAVSAADGVVQTCCLKTHRFGGHFTLSLKNSVGLAAKFVPGDPYNYMRELHASPHQRRMIAEVNTAYVPSLVVLDGVEAFVSGGPDIGEKVNAGVILAGVDRVAIDAVGVAILRLLGTSAEVRRGRIFEQEQLARAAELRIGIGRPDQIDLVTGDSASAAYAKRVRAVLDQQPGMSG